MVKCTMNKEKSPTIGERIVNCSIGAVLLGALVGGSVALGITQAGMNGVISSEYLEIAARFAGASIIISLVTGSVVGFIFTPFLRFDSKDNK